MQELTVKIAEAAMNGAVPDKYKGQFDMAKNMYKDPKSIVPGKYAAQMDQASKLMDKAEELKK